MSTSQDNPADFMRQLWSSMGFGFPGMITPTLDTDDIERRITDLRAVEGWLKMNLSMLQMTIQALEVQRAALSAVKVMSQPDENGRTQNPFSNPALWAWPFPPSDTATSTSPASDKTAPETSQTGANQASASKSPRKK